MDAERAEEREAEVREAEAMQNALEAALHDDVTKSAKRNIEAGPVWLLARPAQTAVAWLAPHDRHPACLRRYGVLDLARRRGWPCTLTERRRGCQHRCSS